MFSLHVAFCETSLLAYFQIAISLTLAWPLLRHLKEGPLKFAPQISLACLAGLPSGTVTFLSGQLTTRKTLWPVTDLRQRFQPSLQCQVTPIPRVGWVLIRNWVSLWVPPS